MCEPDSRASGFVRRNWWDLERKQRDPRLQLETSTCPLLVGREPAKTQLRASTTNMSQFQRRFFSKQLLVFLSILCYLFTPMSTVATTRAITGDYNWWGVGQCMSGTGLGALYLFSEWIPTLGSGDSKEMCDLLRFPLLMTVVGFKSQQPASRVQS